MLMKIADAVERKLDAFVQAESRDQGKPVSLARAIDIPRAVYNFRFFGTAVLHKENKQVVASLVNSLCSNAETTIVCLCF